MLDALSISTSSADSARRALEAFATQNPDLDRLEDLLAQFNIFEAIGGVRHELRHSDFLGFLLDPCQSHGIGDLFLKMLLKRVAETSENPIPVSLLDLQCWDLNKATVQREWQYIDILVLDSVNRVAVIIENKIDTGEHSDQLVRYYNRVRQDYPSYKIFSLFLTPDGQSPSTDLYQAIGYSEIRFVVEELLAEHRTTLHNDLIVVLNHYVQMLKTHIVGDAEISELCRRIYQKHRRALDLIFINKLDRRAEIFVIAKSLVETNPDLKWTRDYGYFVGFEAREWENSPTLHHPLFYFDIANRTNELTVDIWIGEDPHDETVRRNLYAMASRLRWQGMKPKLGKSWTRIFQFFILTANDYELDSDGLAALIHERWTIFLNNVYPVLMNALRQEQWLWNNENETSR